MNDALLKPDAECYFTQDIEEGGDDCHTPCKWKVKGDRCIVLETYDPQHLGFRYRVEHKDFKMQFYVRFNEVSVVNPNRK